ncbi:hypothetical protein [Alkalihalobacillus sp. 1P02AB]|uniref:hypothetical protein n=1 Tax=Alkalihalobacillus sp. 1P02AB TaxID=3132260 RepID=UPI0039A5C8F7
MRNIWFKTAITISTMLFFTTGCNSITKENLLDEMNETAETIETYMVENTISVQVTETNGHVQDYGGLTVQGQIDLKESKGFIEMHEDYITEQYETFAYFNGDEHFVNWLGNGWYPESWTTEQMHFYFLTDYNLVVDAINSITVPINANYEETRDYYLLNYTEYNAEAFEKFAQILGFDLYEDVIKEMHLTMQFQKKPFALQKLEFTLIEEANGVTREAVMEIEFQRVNEDFEIEVPYDIIGEEDQL